MRVPIINSIQLEWF